MSRITTTRQPTPTLSAIDQERFGIVTAKCHIAAESDLGAIDQWCADHHVSMAIARCSTADLDKVQAMEGAGFRLMDTLVYYRKQGIEAAPALPSGYSARLATSADGDAVEALAARTFAGYLGHYHADPCLKREDADLVYSSWAGSSCRTPGVADAVILIESAGRLAAFATLKAHDTRQFEGVLVGVNPDDQGKRLYAGLMALSQQWGQARGHEEMLVSTQLTNLAVQKVWCRQGFEPASSLYTFHKWYQR